MLIPQCFAACLVTLTLLLTLTLNAPQCSFCSALHRVLPTKHTAHGLNCKNDMHSSRQLLLPPVPKVSTGCDEIEALMGSATLFSDGCDVEAHLLHKICDILDFAGANEMESDCESEAQDAESYAVAAIEIQATLSDLKPSFAKLLDALSHEAATEEELAVKVALQYMQSAASGFDQSEISLEDFVEKVF